MLQGKDVFSLEVSSFFRELQLLLCMNETEHLGGPLLIQVLLQLNVDLVGLIIYQVLQLQLRRHLVVLLIQILFVNEQLMLVA